MSPYTRREFTKLALAALPAAGMLSTLSPLPAAETAGKPNSKVKGVQIGLNVPYSFSNPTMSGDEVIRNCVALGLSAVELRTQPVEAFLGSPVPAAVAARGAAVDPGQAKVNADKMEKWRLGVSMEQVKAFRKTFDDAGVKIEIVKVDGIFKMSDGVLDYVFNLAKALGARALSTEISKDEADHARVGKFADKHQCWIGYHGHATTDEEHYVKATASAKFNGINLDIGHYVAGGHGSPVEFLKKHHARVTHVHIKDRKSKANGAATLPFGQGDTPIKDVLRLIRDNRWNIQATLEIEYKTPEGSTRLAEIAKTVQYCRDALA
jgi:sugar phosphate isomerase/epimerase